MIETMHEHRPLFAYGTLMFPEIIQAVIGRVPDQQPAMIAGYRRLVVAGELFRRSSRMMGVVTGSQGVDLLISARKSGNV